ncbi:MAG TPA: alpha-amylase family glycosyl hydrolase, partial [Micavibrio sp.]
MAGNEWWRGGVFYQIYPRSYKDNNGDGIGDLKGIAEKLDHIAGLGVEGIWISPFFKSPMKDYGYDISDYCDVDPLFGTLEDFRALLDKAHGLGLKIIIDVVMSHTSEDHPWFKESCRSADNPKADWYVWADPKPDGTPPNNWLSIFGGSAWQFNVFRGQYYLHNFLKEQPDLNYNNPDVVQAMLDQCRFWLDFGVDGFRLDVINFCTHDKSLRDNPPRDDGGLASQLEFKDAYAMQWHIYDKSRPENMNLVRRLRALLDEYPDKMALAEIGDDNSVKLAAEYTATPDVLHTAYSFALMTNKGAMPPASMFRNKLEEQMAQPGDSWPAWAISNHDVVRAASRWSGTDYGHDPRLSKMLIALLCSLRGTPFIYQGEELGLPEADIPFERILDPWGKYLYPKWKGRDGCRTPMPWSDEETAGFSRSNQTWLPISDMHKALSVETQNKDEQSTLAFTRQFLAWRKRHEAFVTGDIRFIDTGREDVLLFERK